MYYLNSRGRNAQPTPAEAPYVCGADGLHEWNYSLGKHKAALEGIRGLVDQSQPRSVDPAAQRIQASTRRFCEDQRRAEIGRENRKLVDRLSSIARGSEGGGDPRSPPPAGSIRSISQPSLMAAASSVTERGRSLNETFRRKAQRAIDQDNAALVRRILNTKGTFDRLEDVKDFKRHQRASQLLQRLPKGHGGSGKAAQQPRRLPPLRLLHASSFTLPLKGLSELLLPGDLLRLGNGSSSQDDPETQGSLPHNYPAQASPSFRRSASDGRRFRASSVQCRSEPPTGPAANDGASAWSHHDAETERRQWFAGKVPEDVDKLGDTSSSFASESYQDQKEGTASRQASPLSQKGVLTGTSTDSDIKYDDGWDEESMSQSPSPKRFPTRR